MNVVTLGSMCDGLNLFRTALVTSTSLELIVQILREEHTCACALYWLVLLGNSRKNQPFLGIIFVNSISTLSTRTFHISSVVYVSIDLWLNSWVLYGVFFCSVVTHWIKVDKLLKCKCTHSFLLLLYQTIYIKSHLQRTNVHKWKTNTVCISDWKACTFQRIESTRKYRKNDEKLNDLTCNSGKFCFNFFFWIV